MIGDLAALVGPISITLIFEYIHRHLNAPSSTISIASPGAAAVDNNNNSLSHIYNMTQANSVKELPPMLIPMINENTEIYYPTWTDYVSNGWIMSLVVLSASLAQGTMSQSSTHIVNVIGIRLRSSLQSLVYRKTLLISSSCFHANTENTNGAPIADTNEATRMQPYATDDNCKNNSDSVNGNENSEKNKIPANNPNDDNECTEGSAAIEAATAKDTSSAFIDTGSIANLMSEDALNVMSFFWIAHYVWAIPLKVRTYEYIQTVLTIQYTHIYMYIELDVQLDEFIRIFVNVPLSHVNRFDIQIQMHCYTLKHCT